MGTEAAEPADHHVDGSEGVRPGATGPWRPSASEAWRRVREARPTVILAGRSPAIVADTLGALGARPVEVPEPDEVAGIFPDAGALIVDAAALLQSRWGAPVAAARARGRAPAVILVATLVDRSPTRRNEARRLVAEARPAVVRGTPAELAALVGLDHLPPPQQASAASVAQIVAHRTGAVALACDEDGIAYADARTMRSEAQRAPLAQVRLVGAALDATAAATLACGADALAGVRAAYGLVEASLRTCVEEAAGPGSFVGTLLDALGRGPDVEPLVPGPVEGVLGTRAGSSRPDLGDHVAATAPGTPDAPEATHREVTFASLVDAVANRIEGGRVVPGSVPLHLLATPSRDPDAHEATRDRWERVALYAIGKASGRSPDGGEPVAEDLGAAVERVAVAGATAIALDLDGLADAEAFAATHRVVELADARGVAVAVRGRIDVAVAAGATAAWLDSKGLTLPVAAAVMVAAGRVKVIASVASLEEARDAAAAGADILVVEGAADAGADWHGAAPGVRFANVMDVDALDTPGPQVREDPDTRSSEGVAATAPEALA